MGRAYSTVTETAILNAIIHILGCELQLRELNYGLALTQSWPIMKGLL